ncbi:hypothetical protein BJP48_20490 [Paenibacillus odorifer]|nr:hypothetical protein BJP48_20490 [Paenibacillus odorifer]
MSIAFNRKVVPVKKVKEQKKLNVSVVFEDDTGKVVFSSVEEAFSKLSQPEKNKLLARIMSATTGEKYKPL